MKACSRIGEAVLEIVYGEVRDRTLASALIQELNNLYLDGTLYLGYPILATSEEPITADALLITRQYGLIGFQFHSTVPPATDVTGWDSLRDRLDKLFIALEHNLARYDMLRERRRLLVEPKTMAIFPVEPDLPPEIEKNRDFIACGLTNVAATIRTQPGLTEEVIRPLQSALQRVSTIKPRKRRQNATLPDSRGTILKKIEAAIANLDQWQKKAAIESPNGPQRIRGLAGSGKTIVLALKAAYLHAQHPDWIISVTFHTRTLYQQFMDLIRRFSFEHLGDEPNWENLRLRHAWGSRDRVGLYTEIAEHCQVVPKDFLYGRSRYGMEQAFRGVCDELLDATGESNAEPIYDAVLVDEAQDLPTSFFRLLHRFTRMPKRIIWAYDELQKLHEAHEPVPNPSALFGLDETGDLLVKLVNSEGQPCEDIILPVCYRNPPWTLALAHALGLGLCRREGPVQHFDDPVFWTEIGYRVLDGELRPGSDVTIDRSPSSYPEYFTELLRADDVVVSKAFDSPFEQATWIAESIHKNLSEDQLDPDDILIILPDTIRAAKDAAILEEALSRLKIQCHLAGVTTSRDEIFNTRSVAMANIHRSKGNEAAMVYVVNAETCYSGYELQKLRNTLFTAITRSRAWVRVTGSGTGMRELQREIQTVSQANYKLRFKVPTQQELSHIRQLHRELTASEKQKITEAERSLRKAVESINKGELQVENLPDELRAALAKLMEKMVKSKNDTEWDQE